MLKQYADLLADVRGDGGFHSVRSLVQPDEPLVQDVANVLIQSGDFLTNIQDFIHSFTVYQAEAGDYWATPAETLAPICPICFSHNIKATNFGKTEYRCLKCGWQGKPMQAGDCDDLAILCCAIARNYIPANMVYCAAGDLESNGSKSGHMWVVAANKDGSDRIIEATAPSSLTPRGRYYLSILFNDQYAFATAEGLKDYDIVPMPLSENSRVSL